MLIKQVHCPRTELFGAPVDALSMQDVLRVCDRHIAQRSPLLIGVLNAGKLVKMRRDARLRDAVLAADIFIADGMSVVWAARTLGLPVRERITGIDLMTRLLEQAERRGHSVYLLGASMEVLSGAVERIRALHPQLRIAGQHHGYFSEEEAPEIVARIRACEPDILFVGMSSPKKETFLSRWGRRTGAAVCHGVGGSFDVLAGKVQRAPRIWQRCGCEWLYRLLQEPRRLGKRYLVTNTIFLGLLARALVRNWFVRRPTPAPVPAE